MATLWRQISEPQRSNFGGHALRQERLRTKDADEARRTFTVRNARLEALVAEASRTVAVIENARAITPEPAAERVDRACGRQPRQGVSLLHQL